MLLSIRPFAKKLSLSLKIPKPLVIPPISIFFDEGKSNCGCKAATQDCVVVIIVAVAPSARPLRCIFFSYNLIIYSMFSKY